MFQILIHDISQDIFRILNHDISRDISRILNRENSLYIPLHHIFIFIFRIIFWKLSLLLGQCCFILIRILKYVFKRYFPIFSPNQTRKPAAVPIYCSDLHAASLLWTDPWSRILGPSVSFLKTNIYKIKSTETVYFVVLAVTLYFYNVIYNILLS